LEKIFTDNFTDVKENPSTYRALLFTNKAQQSPNADRFRFNVWLYCLSTSHPL